MCFVFLFINQQREEIGRNHSGSELTEMYTWSLQKPRLIWVLLWLPLQNCSLLTLCLHLETKKTKDQHHLQTWWYCTLEGAKAHIWLLYLKKKKRGGGVKNCFHRILFPPSKIIIWFSVLTVVSWVQRYAMNLWLYHLIRGHRRCEYIQTVCRILFSDPDMVWTMLSAFFHLKHKYKSFKEYFLLVPHFTLLKLSRNSVLFLLLFN